MDINEKWQQKKKRFFLLWQQFLNNKNNHEDVSIKEIWETLTTRYSEPARFYHTREHILDCLNQFDLAKAHIPDQQSVELAIWFHDIVFDTQAQDNEEQSAFLFQELTENQFPEPIVTKVSELILATLHIDKPHNLDQAFMLDIDLSSIAGSWQRFSQDNNDLRKEVRYLTDKEYCQKKIHFFNMLLERERIFFTDYFYNSCEQQARQNMENYIQNPTLDEQCHF